MTAPQTRDEMIRVAYDALDAAQVDERGWQDNERFLGFRSPEEPYLLLMDIVECVVDAICGAAFPEGSRGAS